MPSNITPLYFFVAQTYTLFKRSPLKYKFLRFFSARVKIVKFLMSILNGQYNSSSNFASILIVMRQNSLVNFKVIHFLLWIKGSHQSPKFLGFQRCSGKNLLNSSFIFESTIQFSFKCSSIFSAIKHNSSILFFAQTLYTLVKSSLLKCKFLRFSIAWVKTRQIPHVNFELTSQFLIKFCIILHCHDTKPSCKFKAHTFSTLDERIKGKSQF